MREATVADVDIIVRHRRAMFADMGWGDDAGRDAMATAARPFIEAGLRDGSYRGWLIEDGGSVVAAGGVALVPFQPTPFDPTPRRAWIVNVYTEPSHRRRGLARAMIEHIIAWCADHGIPSISLHASVAGRPLYEHLGFTPTNEMRLVLAVRSAADETAPPPR